MSRIIQLSDLHLSDAPSAEQSVLLRSLVVALTMERKRRGPVDLICVTGDVFDSASLPARRAVPVFERLLDEVHSALGGAVPTVIVPGNHDRRRAGLFSPGDPRLFLALAEALRGRAFVHTADPFLAEVVPPELHGLPLWLVAYDSNHLPEGLIGAGGALRREDLLRAAAIIDGHNPDWPVLFLLHHHLIPTPLTDLGAVETDGAPRPVRWLLEKGLPKVLAHADREELYMTSLGAGTALSTLHALGRAVLVLHGHKHYATSRLLSGTIEGQGDVLIVSGGSAGTAQRWQPSPHRDTARLWPSFNVIDLDAGRIEVEQVSFGWRAASPFAIARHPMVTVERSGPRMQARPVRPGRAVEPGPRLTRNEARYSLLPSPRFGGARWEAEVQRRVTFVGREGRYTESIDAPSGARWLSCRGALVDAKRGFPLQLEVEPAGACDYRVDGLVARTVSGERAIVGPHATPYGRIGLMNRYRAEVARLRVEGLGDRVSTVFGSATDLGTGLERPLPVHTDRGAERAWLELRDCPPRTLLRLYWLLEDAALPAGSGEIPAPAAAATPRVVQALASIG